MALRVYGNLESVIFACIESMQRVTKHIKPIGRLCFAFDLAARVIAARMLARVISLVALFTTVSARQCHQLFKHNDLARDLGEFQAK
jgi:hypothetical protein